MKRFFRFALALVGASVLMVGCGGGTSQIEPFIPERVLAFGDELSSFAPDGRKYSVNALNADGSGAIDCASNPLWIQSVVSLYDYRFPECLGTAAQAKAFTRAVPGATVAGVKAQIDAQAAAGFAAKDLAIVMAGLNDVRQIYEARAAGESEDQLIARARERGTELAAQVNRLVNLGAKVVVSTMPDLGITPYALAKGATEAGLLKRLSAAFNGRLRVGILADGRFVGLALADELLQSAVTVPTAYGLTNVVDAACLSTVVLPNCTTAASSLVSGATPDSWLWADSLRFGPAAHRQLGLVAASRARSNPF